MFKNQPIMLFSNHVSQHLAYTWSILQKAIEFLGSLDVLVLNHAVFGKGGFWLGTSKNVTILHKVMIGSFESFVLLTSQAVPHLEKTSGSIAVISSMAGKVSLTNTIYDNTILPIWPAFLFLFTFTNQSIKMGKGEKTELKCWVFSL